MSVVNYLYRSVLCLTVLLAGAVLSGAQPVELSHGNQVSFRYLSGAQDSIILQGYAGHFIRLSSETGIDLGTHVRYQQVFDGIPVDGANIILHHRHDEVTVSGIAHRLNPELKHQASAYRLKKSVSAVLPVWFFMPSEGTYSLAEVKSGDQGFGMHETLLTDAETGDTLIRRSHRCFVNTPSTAETSKHGLCSITSFLNQGGYILETTNRGQGIFTKNLNHQSGYGSITSFVSSSSHWTQPPGAGEKYATDAHFCAEQYYDFLMTSFGRNSLDGNGFPLRSYLNYGNGMVNAFWNGQAVVYGGGNAITDPLTVIDVAGHEFTHGLIQKTAGLVYAGEPGIINEAVSDILGAALEDYAFPGTANWQIGERSGRVLRCMEFPENYQQPSSYLSNYWYYGNGDNGGVHINSGFINKWFQLLTDGGNGTTAQGWPWNVQGIGLQQSVRIVYHTLVAYLVPQSGFRHFYTSSLQAATDLYGACSPQYLAVAEAWKAVGYYHFHQQVPVIITTDSIACMNDTIRLFAGALPGSQWLWFRNDTLVASGNLTEYPANAAGVYHVAENRCGTILNSDPRQLVFLSLPAVTAVNATACPDQPVHLRGYPEGGYFSVANPYTGPATNFEYSFTDSNGCTGSSSGTISFYTENPLVMVASDTVIPVNGGIIELSSNMNAVFSGPGVNGNRFDPLLTGTGGPFVITGTATGASGCLLTGSILIHVTEPCLKDFSEAGFTVFAKRENGRTFYNCTANEPARKFKINWKLADAGLSEGSLRDYEISFSASNGPVTVSMELANSCNENFTITKVLHEPETVHSISIFPNPSDGMITLQGSGDFYRENSRFEIIDVTGKKVAEGMMNLTGVTRLDLTSLPSGVYKLRLTDDTGTRSESILIR